MESVPQHTLYRRSEQVNELAAAMATAQGLIAGAAKESSNPYFKSKYADLSSIWDAIRVPLSRNGLAVLQLPTAEGPSVTITTILTHVSGQWIESALTVTAKEDAPQAVGSAITYARRYALQSVIGVAPDDDDGEGASGRQRNTPKQQAELAQRRIAEERAKLAAQEPPPAPPDPPESGFHADDSDIPTELGGTHVSGPNPAEARIAAVRGPVATTEPVDPEIQLLWHRLTTSDRYGRLAVFKELKQAIVRETGSDAEYYRILRANGVDKSDQFKSLNPAKAAARMLFESIRQIQDLRQPAEQAEMFDQSRTGPTPYDGGQ